MKGLFRCLALTVALLATATMARAADLNGRWTGTMDIEGNQVPVVMELKVSGNDVSGTVMGQNGPTEIHDGKLENETISLWVDGQRR